MITIIIATILIVWIVVVEIRLRRFKKLALSMAKLPPPPEDYFAQIEEIAKQLGGKWGFNDVSIAAIFAGASKEFGFGDITILERIDALYQHLGLEAYNSKPKPSEIKVRKVKKDE